MSLTEEAAAAYAAWQTAEDARVKAEAEAAAQAAQEAAAALEAQRTAMLQAARDAVRVVLGSGTARALGSFDPPLTLAHSELDPVGKTGLVVYSDGTVDLGAQLEAGSSAWRVRLVRMTDGAWSTYGDRRNRNLAELGAALAAG